MKKLKKILKSVCTALGAVVIICGVCALATELYNRNRVYVPAHSALTVDFDLNYAEVPQDSLLDEFLDNKSTSFQDLLRAIGFAASDDNIDMLVARINVTSLEPAQVQDAARAVEYFKTSGKPAYIFSQGFGPFGQGNREYYLASFFDKIYMQPHTTIGLTGVSVEVPFFKEPLQKIGVEAEFYARKEYKTAMNSFTDDKMSKPFRAEMQKLASEFMSEFESGISANRKLKKGEFADIVNKAPLTAEQGLKLGLVDRLMYMPQLEDKLKKDGVQNFVSAEDYASQIRPNKGNLPVIAVLNLSGVIDTGDTFYDAGNGYVLGSRSVLADLAEIEDIDNLKALVVRIDSPGGSYNAADEIYYAIKRLKKEKKIPVIISQSGYAASGGYFISLAGDVIITEPMTITGSVGVLGGKFSLENLWKKLGVKWDSVKTGDNSDILSPNKKFSAAEKKLFNASLDDVYADFTAKVLENRKLKQNIDKVARGRVWTGRQAVELGLADELGGFDDALMKAHELSGIGKEKFKQVTYPREKSFAEKLRSLAESGGVRINGLSATAGRVDIRYLKLFKQLQYDTILQPFVINM